MVDVLFTRNVFYTVHTLFYLNREMCSGILKKGPFILLFCFSLLDQKDETYTSLFHFWFLVKSCVRHFLASPWRLYFLLKQQNLLISGNRVTKHCEIITCHLIEKDSNSLDLHSRQCFVLSQSRLI